MTVSTRSLLYGLIDAFMGRYFTHRLIHKEMDTSIAKDSLR
jgi:hypothetical protein